MKLLELKASNYRSLREETVSFGDLNVFIGANGSGKSTVIDALRFFYLGLELRDFREVVSARRGFSNLAWAGEDVQRVSMSLQFQDGTNKYNWSVALAEEGYEFWTHEEVTQLAPDGTEVELLSSQRGAGWWRSGKNQIVQLQQGPTVCSLATASADANFPARNIADFVAQWGFFDPSPFVLRQERVGIGSTQLDAFGRNLAERLFRLKESSPETFHRIVGGTKHLLGIPTSLDPKELEGSYYFTQLEPGLKYPVHQGVTSAGTARMLALMTALLEDRRRGLIAIEEPENNIHPAALGDFTTYLAEASGDIQILITTHSPILLDFMDDPSAVSIVRRDEIKGTRVIKESNPEGVKKALEESGFSLGEHHQVRGFG